ncbi:membrane protein US12 [Panine betaherpesvirus 2]|uniref:Membrane protein US12 n=1 Tax=Panine betaherpesvirus 2 TaxID=188763 RepID=Q8QRU7_9BETA|nr:membrane protein US12 [Panine betaherpesvirus 2]AAM00791.1 membrane protein US12 [Panine betaherpesvirus 2]QXV67909.1 membrane protein US12 [Panine betaherpesvirus 2]
MVQIQFHQGEPLGKDKSSEPRKKEEREEGEKTAPSSSPPTPPSPASTTTTIPLPPRIFNPSDEQTWKGIQHFLWIVRLYGIVTFMSSATLVATILCMLVPWRIEKVYLRDTLPVWGMLIPCMLRQYGQWMQNNRKPGSLLMIMVYTALTTLPLAVVGLCFDKSLIIQAYVVSSAMCVWATGLAWLMAWHVSRRLAIMGLLSLAVPLLWLFVAIQPWAVHQRVVMGVTVGLVYALQVLMIRDTLMILYLPPATDYADGGLLRTATILYMDQVIMFLLTLVPLTSHLWFPTYAESLNRTAQRLLFRQP